jgi:hypothetical protein
MKARMADHRKDVATPTQNGAGEAIVTHASYGCNRILLLFIHSSCAQLTNSHTLLITGKDSH